jgi:hypothetical protein
MRAVTPEGVRPPGRAGVLLADAELLLDGVLALLHLLRVLPGVILTLVLELVELAHRALLTGPGRRPGRGGQDARLPGVARPNPGARSFAPARRG